METYLIVCYGTLRKGFPNHYLLSSSTLIGNGKLVKPAIMYSRGAYPILSFSPSSQYSIVVEVYEVDAKTLAMLDKLEGFPGWFDRTQEEVELQDGQRVVGWVYHQDEQKSLKVVQSGDWAIEKNISTL